MDLKKGVLRDDFQYLGHTYTAHGQNPNICILAKPYIPPTSGHTHACEIQSLIAIAYGYEIIQCNGYPSNQTQKNKGWPGRKSVGVAWFFLKNIEDMDLKKGVS